MKKKVNPLYDELAKAVRILSIDAVEKAQSGHPGMPLGMADIATVLWKKFLKHNPKNPYWFNRDRFVVSNGHGSMLLYALLHLTGYNLSIDDIKQFRQAHSKTPGHPEYGETPGVETTTGPLGQGLANAVGMAIAEKNLATTFNRDDLTLVDHYTYVFVGDGCLMEGISHEACSLAGTLGLGKLIVFYDDNGISIDGAVNQWFTDETSLRFKAYHWQVLGPINGHDTAAIEKAILEAQKETQKPSMIICKTTIGFASPVAGTEKAHGAPLGTEGIAMVRKTLDWPYAPFDIPQSLYAAWNHEEQGKALEHLWLLCCKDYQKSDKHAYETFLRRINGDLPFDLEEQARALVHQASLEKKALATRRCSQLCLEAFAPHLPELFGGSADLTASNNTNWSQSKAITAKDSAGNYLFYGVREFGMAAIMNGLSVHGGFIPYGGTFLVFTDYARSAIRMAALMKIRAIYVLTHDSIGLGEDGPTHQPVEHAAMLRITPNMHVWRPADWVETAVSWYRALKHRTGPSALLLSRQNLPALNHGIDAFEKISRGGYILKDCNGVPECILIATGSEVQLALAATDDERLKNFCIRVVSMPSCTEFLAQDDTYQSAILPPSVRKRVAIEAAASTYWYRFVGLDGKIIGLDCFGLSAKAADVYQDLGVTVEAIVQAVVHLITN